MRDSPPVHPVPLAYHADAGAAPPARAGRRWRAVMAIAMLPALVVPFVNFACDVTPVEAAVLVPAEWLKGEPVGRESAVLWLASLPFFLAFPVVYWALRPRAAAVRLALTVLGAAGATAVCGVVVLLAPSTTNAYEVGLLALAGGILLLAAAAFVRLAVARADADARVTLALCGPYAANAAFCLVLWPDDAQLGWFLTLAPAAAALVEVGAAVLAALAVRRDAT
jgi:hypothetical protein